MGIQLPSELADVAARAGVRWPQADEDAMRTSAQAWRQAGTKLTALAKDADGTAGQALSAVSGATGTAARQHWQTFVAPDTGHLTSAAKGCTDAADRLDHAADQVGAAKVRIVSHLVNLAQHTDAANQAAAAGHPTALAGIQTIVHGTANDVAQVNHSLTSSIRLDNVVQPAAAPLPAHAAAADQGILGTGGLTGSHGPLGDQGLLGSGAPAGPPPQVAPAGVPGPAGQQTGPIDGLHHATTPPMGVTVTSSAAPAVAPPAPTTTGPAELSAPAVAPVPHQAPPPGFTSGPTAPTPAFGTPAAPPPQAAPPQPGATPVTRQAPSSAAAPVPVAQQQQQRQQAADLPVAAAVRKPGVRRDEVALFLVYLFPIGQLPQPSSRPSRQLPPPARETDFAAGLRFAPHDHPESHLMEAGGPGEGPTHPGLTPVPELAEGHDPLGGDSERNWDRRFLVRPAADGQAAEYAWPPGELFPEGGADVGEPVVLDPDTVLDRFGCAEGRVFGEDGTVFARRSLPPDHLAAGYHRYKIVKALPVWRTLSAAWFGQPGGGVRYRAVYPAADLVAMGYLMEITGMADGH